MKSTKKTIILGFIILFLYFILINAIPLLDFSQMITKQENQSPNQISVHDSVSVSVEGQRWYGKFVRIGDSEDIYLLGLIKLPKKHNGFNFIPLHIFFILISSETLLLLNQKWRKHETPA